MRRFRELVATMALLAFLLPCARVVSVSTHLATAHHHAPGGHRSSDLEDALHGHHHPPGEASHQHALIGSDVVLQRLRVIADLMSPPAEPSLAMRAILPTAGGLAGVRRETISDHGPPRGPRRAILRI